MLLNEFNEQFMNNLLFELMFGNPFEFEYLIIILF